eukprot:10151848-Heterocapsa_arctica.AAC.1
MQIAADADMEYQVSAINEEHHQVERFVALKLEMNADNVDTAKAVAEIQINDSKTEALLSAMRKEHHETLPQLEGRHSDMLYVQQQAAAQAASEALVQSAAQ